MAFKIKAGAFLRSLAWRFGAGLLPITIVAGLLVPAVAQVQEPSLAIDVSPGDNEATKPGEIENCIEVPVGHVFDVDLIIEDIEELLAWEIGIEYDTEFLEVIARDVTLFQEANAGSSVFDLSEALPDDDGMIRLSAADTSDPPTPDSGSGTLARLTLRALTVGESALSVVRRDSDGDGKLEFGPFLRDVSGVIVGDLDGDTFFDGPAVGALVAIESPCPADSNSATIAGDGESSSTWIFVGGGVALAMATLAGGILLYRRTVSPL